jgi:hypothetical protein
MTSRLIWIVLCTATVFSTGLGAVLVLRRQSRRPLGWALLIAAVSLAAAIAILGGFRNQPPNVWLSTHIAAGLCLGWMIVCLLIGRHAPKIAGGYHAVEVIEFVSLTSGMVAVAVLAYAAAIEVAFRLFYLAGSDVPGGVFPFTPIPFRQSISPRVALLDIAAVTAATGIGVRLRRQPVLTTLLFWLAAFASVWIGLLIDPVRPARGAAGGHGTLGSMDWPVGVMVCAAIVLFAFVWAHRASEFFVRRRAWPDALHELLAPSTVWPGFRASVGLVAVAVLAVGCLMVTRDATALAAAIAAAAMFLFVDRSFSENLTETGMALMTLAVVSASMFGAKLPEPSPNGYPILFHRALVALAVMIWFWHWLMGIWHEQLDHGRAWTTAGRMIPALRRVGFIVGAIGVLITLLLATWPQRSDVTDPDRSPERWIGGMLGIGLIFAALVYAAIRSGKPTVGWLSLFALGALGAFAHFRTRGTATHSWVAQHMPLLLACAAPAVGSLPRLLRMSRANPYAEVFTFGGTVIAPLGTLVALFLMEDSELAGRWVATGVLAVLAGWYGVLSVSPRLRDLLWIALAFANLAAIDLWNQRGSPVAVVSVAAAVQVTISGWVLVYVYWRVLRTPAARIIAALTAPGAGVLAAIVVTILRQRL